MNVEKRKQINRTLRGLAQAHAATIGWMKETLSLLSDEFSLDPFSFW